MIPTPSTKFMDRVLFLALLPTFADAENVLLIFNNDTNFQGLPNFLASEGHCL
ncbi:hypothetical protein V2O64_10800 [Verrucomicrobiaceae bacterium 227]